MVRWSEGENFGKLSDIKTSAIRGYDDSKMDQDANPISNYSAVIEWRRWDETTRRVASLQRHCNFC